MVVEGRGLPHLGGGSKEPGHCHVVLTHASFLLVPILLGQTQLLLLRFKIFELKAAACSKRWSFLRPTHAGR